jgi:hypothetical protein
MKTVIINFALAACIFIASCTSVPVEPDDSTVAGAALPSPRPFANPRNDDEYFFNYRLEAFAPSTEPFIRETFGNDLRLEPDAFWEHTAFTSHAVGFATNLPSLSVVEYGETAAYGMRTEPSDSYYYQHLHYIKGLQPGVTYHYRIMTQDNDGRTVFSGDFTCTPAPLPTDAVRIPEDMPGDAPYTLDKANAFYVLTCDLNVPTLAINIRAHNVTIELDGHTITYDNDAPKVTSTTWNGYAYNEEATFGIRAGLWNFMNAKVYNGTVRQGRNGGSGVIGTGFGPLYLNHMGAGSQNEIAGLTLDYYGDNISGAVTGNGRTHHNVVYDRGSGIDDRHMGILAASIGDSDANEFYCNSLRRFRHQGVRGSGRVHHNEMYSDSFATNSFMITQSENGTAEDNKLFGMGYLPIGIGWSNHTVTRRNFIYIHGYAPSQRSDEYARKSAVAGMRITNYSESTFFDDMLYEDNVIVIKAEDGCAQARGIWTSNNMRNSRIVYRRNTVKVEAMPGNVLSGTGSYYNGDVNNAVSAVTVCDDDWVRPPDGSAGLPGDILFEDNRLIGNVNLLIVGDGYGIGNSVRMVRTKLEKIEHDSEYFRPVRLGFWYWNTFNNRMIDSQTVNFDDSEMTPHFYGGNEGRMEMSYGVSHAVNITGGNSPLRNTSVTVTPEGGYPVRLVTDGNGRLTFDLLTVRHLSDRGAVSHGGYAAYTFAVDGYRPSVVSFSRLETATTVSVEN